MKEDVVFHTLGSVQFCIKNLSLVLTVQDVLHLFMVGGVKNVKTHEINNNNDQNIKHNFSKITSNISQTLQKGDLLHKK